MYFNLKVLISGVNLLDIYREWFVCVDFDEGDNGPVVVLWTGDDMGGEGLSLELT